TIKGVIDTWYASNLKSYATYIDANAGFCNDRTPYSGTGVKISSTEYKSNNRLFSRSANDPATGLCSPYNRPLR
ncbi:MAG: hypothetical protein IJZ18_05970, partial [Mailhella sp.]|nr:hypothetical protein [Mailhella sp.]